MKNALSIVLLSFVIFTVSATSALAQTNMCNQRCDVDTDCGSGYRCYVGVCRLDLCPASSSCSCAGAVSATPVSTPKATAKPTATPTPTPTPKPTLAPKPTTTPKSTASPAATLKRSPKTGVSPLLLLVSVVGLYFLGVTLEKKSATSK